MSTHDDPRDPFDAAHRTVAESDPPTALVHRDSVRELLPGSVVDDTYEVDARLGAGAMGEVYAAHHIKLGKRVAIKVIGRRLSEDEAAIERFAMEARTLAQIQHPAIVAVEHVGELADGRAYFVMEFLRGETLFDRISRGRVPIAEALRILDQLARGLDAAHGSGVTHRDLKPENVFLVHLPGEPPIVKLVDFGLAKLAADAASVDRRAERTQSGAAIGTPMYMSPEQMRGPDVDYRTDVYALGCVAYELLLGAPPFPHACTAPELYAAHLHEAHPLPRAIWPEVPPQLDLVLFAMLAKDPAHRPTLAQVRSVLAAVQTSASTAQRAATEFVRPRRTTRKLTITAIAIAALIGGITIGVTTASKSASKSTAVPAARAVSSPAQPPVAASAPPPVEPPRLEAPIRTVRPPASRAKRGEGTPSTAPQTVDPVAKTPDPPQLPKSPPPPGIDRNQTINPFKRKATP